MKVVQISQTTIGFGTSLSINIGSDVTVKIMVFMFCNSEIVQHSGRTNRSSFSGSKSWYKKKPAASKLSQKTSTPSGY
jgi:hypothetical protein